MEAYEQLQAPGCVDSSVELSHVSAHSENEGINWFPDQAPVIEAAEACETSWHSEDDNEFFWQELTEEELSERQGLKNHDVCIFWWLNILGSLKGTPKCVGSVSFSKFNFFFFGCSPFVTHQYHIVYLYLFIMLHRFT